MSPRTGRPPKQKTPRNKSLNIRLTESELNMIEDCAKNLNENRTDVIVKGVELLYGQIKKATD